MENFAVVQSLVKAGLLKDDLAVRKQAERLRVRLEKSGDVKDADTLMRLLRTIPDVKEMAPSQVEVSRVNVSGETLTPNVNPPIDRETGAQLCSVDFPNGGAEKPIYNEAVGATIDGILNEWKNVNSLKKVGVLPTNSLLIYGPPGTGKTITASYISYRMSLPMVTARIDGLISSFLGTTARNIANLFDFANRYACVLLLDEFDALAKLRDDPHEIGEIKRVVNTLLQNLDIRKKYGLTIAITNHDRLLDPAVWRRFETQIFVGVPNNKSRESLISRFLLPIIADPALVKIFAYCLPDVSGADLQRICYSVKRNVALCGSDINSPSLFDAFSKVISLSSNKDCKPAMMLSDDRDAFISLIANDQNIDLKQDDIGRVTGMSQGRVSTIKSAKRHLTYMGG